MIILEAEPFESISDFKWSMHCGGEVQFDYQGSSYSIVHVKNKIVISKAYQPETELISENIEDILDYLMDNGKKLREVMKEIELTERTI